MHLRTASVAVGIARPGAGAARPAAGGALAVPGPAAPLAAKTPQNTARKEKPRFFHARSLTECVAPRSGRGPCGR